MASDILLINPFSWTRDGRAAYLPYGLLYLAGYLRRRRIKVAVHDCNVTPFTMGLVKYLRPRVVGLSVLTGPVIREALGVSRGIKEYHPEVSVVWGGLHPTLFPVSCALEKSVDYIIQGEGEESLYRLLLDMPYKDVYDKAELIDLNNEDMPAWDMVDINRYFMNKHYGKKVLTLNTSRGCVNDCAFCFNQAMNTKKWRALSGENIFRQVQYIHHKYGIDGVQFYEDNFDVLPSRVLKFCERMIESGLNKKVKWAHFSTVKKADPALIEIEKRAGCREIAYGVESGSNRILELLNKHQTVDDTKRAFDICHKVGVKATALFMIGLPTETEAEINETVRLISELKTYQDICTIYRPYPRTALHDYCGFEAPTSLEAQADFYAYGEFGADVRNVSHVPTKRLLELQGFFYRGTLQKELLHAVKDLNGQRLRYLFREGLRSLWR